MNKTLKDSSDGVNFRRWLIFFLIFVVIVIAVAIPAARYSREATRLVNQYRDVRITPTRESTIIYDRSGHKLATLFKDENREYAPLSEIPPKLTLAFLSIEDRDFFNHRGVNPFSIARAMLHNLRSDTVQGGSTITQQLARNLYLNQSRTWDRKIREAIVAVMIERNFNKQEILESYLNQINLGHGAWGVKTASRIYFGKDMKDLTIAECALLAGIPKSPTHYNPINYPDQALSRRHIVLRAMLDTGSITQEEYEQADKEQLRLADPAETAKAPYFVDWVKRMLINNPDYGSEKVFGGGLRIYTTLDLDMQEKAEAAADFALTSSKQEDRNVSQVAIIVIDPETGAIRAMVGGRKYGDNVALGESKFNRATQALRQPGSSFKPFVYITALRQGASMRGTQMNDSRVCYQAWKKLWCPRNYGDKEYGTITLEHALMVSNNRIAVKITNLVGVDSIIQTARDMGLTTEIPRNLSSGLGSCVVKPVELVNAYGILANGGYKISPQYIEKITDASGGVLYEANPGKKERILPQLIATQMVLAMKRGVAEGTGKKAFVTDRIGRAIAGKTGTTSDFHDAWFVGFTPDLAVLVWVGNDNNKPMTNTTTGGTIPARTWAYFMTSVFPWSPEDGNIMDFPFATSLPEEMQQYFQTTEETPVATSNQGVAPPVTPGTEETFPSAATGPIQQQ